LVHQYETLFFEKLNIRGLARGFLSRHIHDAAWSSFLSILVYKAEEAGRKARDVEANGTSQRCPCGAKVPKTLKDRWHQCHDCGLSVPRDHASALEILRLGLGCSLQDITGAGGLSVS
jgi:putative transposase